MNKTIVFVALLFILALVACSSEPEKVEVTRVVTDIDEIEITRLVEIEATREVEVTREVVVIKEVEREVVSEGIESDGVWCYRGLPRDPSSDFLKVDGNNYYWTSSDVGQWTGVFAGTSEEYWMMIEHRSGRQYSIGTILFDSIEIDGSTGSLELYAIGESPPERISSEGKGTWVITDGTGDLENLQGHGTWWGQGWQGNYSVCGEVDYSVEELEFKSE